MKYGRFFTCETCTSHPEFAGIDAIKSHLRETHELTEPMRGSRQLVMHLDARDHYSYVYSWKFEPICTVTETNIMPRGKR